MHTGKRLWVQLIRTQCAWQWIHSEGLCYVRWTHSHRNSHICESTKATAMKCLHHVHGRGLKGQACAIYTHDHDHTCIADHFLLSMTINQHSTFIHPSSMAWSNTAHSYKYFLVFSPCCIYYYKNYIYICMYNIIIQTQVVYLPDWALGPSIITVDLAYADSIQVINAILAPALVWCMHRICQPLPRGI